MTRLLKLVLLATAISFLSACGGGSDGQSGSQPPTSSSSSSGSGSGGSSSSSSSSGSSSSGGTRNDLEPGSYVSVSSCVPFEGSETAALKFFFINLNDAPYFDILVENAVYSQLKTLVPYNEYFSSMAFYKLEISNGEDYSCEGTGGSLSGSGFACDDEKIHTAIQDQCPVDDVNGLIKVVFAESEYGGSGGEVIYIGVNPAWETEESALSAQRNTVAHEVGHNFGLADLYGGGIYSDGSPEGGWPSEISRQWLNLDSPGCGKWCNAFKPASEYTQSASAACHTFTNKENCITYNRSPDGDCSANNEDSFYECCAWSETEVDDYFQSQCTPVWGSENIGLDCLDGAGCYYGGAYGNNSWRPVKSWNDSIMYDQQSEAFDSVSERELREALRCCASSDDGTESCVAFRSKYAEFLYEYQPFKQRVGSCGIGPTNG